MISFRTSKFRENSFFYKSPKYFILGTFSTIQFLSWTLQFLKIVCVCVCVCVIWDYKFLCFHQTAVMVSIVLCACFAISYLTRFFHALLHSYTVRAFTNTRVHINSFSGIHRTILYASFLTCFLHFTWRTFHAVHWNPLHLLTTTQYSLE